MSGQDGPQVRPGRAATRLYRRWRGGGLGRLMLVTATDLDGDGHKEIVAVAGRDVKIFGPRDQTFALLAETDLPRDGLSVAAGRIDPPGPGSVAVGTRDGVLLYAYTDAGLQPAGQTLLFPGAYFRSLTLADVNGDGRAEVVAAASGAQTLYIFGVLSVGGEPRLEELGRMYVGGLVSSHAAPGQVATGSRDGFVDVFVPCALLPDQNQVLYAVRRGDSLWRIARQFGTSVAAIARLNRLSEPYHLQAGQVLLIPRNDEAGP